MRNYLRSQKLATFFLAIALLLACVACSDSQENASQAEFLTPITNNLLRQYTSSQYSSDEVNAGVDLWFIPKEAEGCQAPSDSYGLVEINGFILNQRTVEMLEYAYELYGGLIDIRGPALTQGSYSLDSPESFFTHAGGGAVDISVYDKNGERWVLLEDEIEPVIGALRVAGFAAWYRPADYERQGSPAHIHAIAIGDLFLSPEATRQIDGRCGYFNGRAGLPIMDYECKHVAEPRPDIHGGPVVCDWMCALPYPSLSGELLCKNWE
jgi:hypothetical protein